MCGINGFVSGTFSEKDRERIVQHMNNILSHRGPDNDGIWSCDNTTLGHRRLSIIDLSPDCNQPFFSTDGRYVIVYNGELYNYKDLKLQLQGAKYGSEEKPYLFKTNSDTEVVLASFIRWGTKALDYFNGMYAFAIYDKQLQKLTVVRDRLGVKPLYYFYGDEGFLFSSEVRTIIKAGVRKFSLNRELMGEYAMYQTVFAPNTIIKGIKVLMPGHLLEYENGKAIVSEYYSTKKISNATFGLSYAEVCNKINELLTASVQRRMISDVPFGAFLSGGIDSSVIVGLMSKVSTEKIQTFNISFDESKFSEAKYARQIANKFNTTHHEIKLTPEDFLKQLPAALAAMDHPGGDGPNTYIVSKATKEAGITMALSGLGGDELFAGYDVFKRMKALEKKAWINAIPRLVRKPAAALIAASNGGIRAVKIRELLSLKQINFESAYPLARTLFGQRELQRLVGDQDALKTTKEIMNSVPRVADHLLSAVSIAEINTYLQNILLRDADQMGMAVALEIREPFLDHKLLEFVLSVADEYKYPHSPKKLLTDSMGTLLPSEVVNRPKMGFTLPWQLWLRKELKSFCESNISAIEKREIFKQGGMKHLWQQFLNNDPTVTWSRVWPFIVLNHWMDLNQIE